MELNESFISALSVSMSRIIGKISEELGLEKSRVEAAAALLKEGNTVPFISRYRKEATRSLDEIEVRDISHRMAYLENLEQRRIEVARGIFLQGKLTEDLYVNINKCETLSELEELYLPYRKKKKTRAMAAMEKDLGPLADLMTESADIEKEAVLFINSEKGVNNAEEALGGAMDILAERLAQDMDMRKTVLDFIKREGEISVKGKKDPETSIYKMYYDYREPVREIKPHRILAINRGQREGELDADIVFDEEKVCDIVLAGVRIANSYQKSAVIDGLSRLLIPSVLRDLRGAQSDAADSHGISIFAGNLKGLLMQPPIKRTRVLGVDPGIRTGTKAAALDENGKYLGYFLFFQKNKEESIKAVGEAVKKYNIQLIAVGNGTGSPEVCEIVAGAIIENDLPAEYTIVAEEGASVYSASDLAREEFPDLDLLIRGAISIGRRIQDPLAEFVKIDPRSIGVGLYQHDLNQKALGESLHEVVESVVNNVGVNINTASSALLRYVSGITPTLSKNIVEYRDKHGLIRSREDLKNIAGLGDRTYEQSAGFLKIPESKEKLDNTWVHPENYAAAREIMTFMGTNRELSGDKKNIVMEKFGIGETTVADIIEELKKPNRDPRDGYPAPLKQKDIVRFEDLAGGMTVKGKVKNVVDFGAFIDIGIKETALVHISELSDNYVKNPMDVVQVGDIKDFRIIEVDPVRKRISLSLKKTPASYPAPRIKEKEKKKIIEPEIKEKQTKISVPPPAGTLGSFLKKPLDL